MADELNVFGCAINQVGNPWLNHETECHDSEKAMNANLKTEIINLTGLTFRYYTVEGSDPTLYRGFQLKTVSRAFKVKVSMEDMPAQARIAGLMGLFDDTLSKGIIAKGHWAEASTYGAGFGNPGSHAPMKAPRVGDIIYSEASNVFYDVIDVNDEGLAFQYSTGIWSIGFKLFEDKRYEIGNDESISPDDPIRRFQRNDIDVGVSADLSETDNLFTTPKKAIEDNARIYKPGDVELPPNNDKDNPFPTWW
jgi:hypothetical protein